MTGIITRNDVMIGKVKTTRNVEITGHMEISGNEMTVIVNIIIRNDVMIGNVEMTSNF